MQAGDKLGRLELIRQLGEGAMAVVWLAEDPLLERQVAIKVLRREARHDTQYVERFLEDARAAARLNHPNIVRVVDVDHSGELPYIIMEVVEGVSLDGWLEKQGKLEIGRAAELGRDIASALAAAHAAGIVHRDIKPSNVLIEIATGACKLSDFGAAKRERTSDTSLTTHGQLIGTPRYMAPEQINGEAVSPQTDLFAFGASLFEMLAGRPAFNARNRELLFRAILLDPTPDLKALRPEVPDGLVKLINELLARPMDERPASAAAVAERLAAYIGWTPGDADPHAAQALPEQKPAEQKSAEQAPPAKPSSRNIPVKDGSKRAAEGGSGAGGKIAAGLAVIALLGGLGWWLTRPGTEPSPETAEQPTAPDQPAVTAGGDTVPGETPPAATVEPVQEPAQAAAPARPTGAQLLGCTNEAGCLSAAAVLDALGSANDDPIQIRTNTENGIWHERDYIVVTVTAPAFHGGYLQLDVMTDAGEAYHLLPEEMTPAHAIEAGRELRVGVEESERRPGVRHWQAAEPFGKAYLLATVSDKPLYDASRGVIEPLEPYRDALLGWLREGLAGKVSVKVTQIAFEPRAE